MSQPRRHPSEDPALEGMIRSMGEFSRRDEAEHLTETSKAKQRADLLALATSMSSISASSSSESSAPRAPRRFLPKRIVAFAAAFAVLVLVLNLSLSALPGRRSSSVAKLLVPAAQSAQAFALEPAQALPGGMDPQAGWMLTASVPASREALEKAIRVDPPVPVRVEKADEGWRVIPEEMLAPNTVYTITLATALTTAEQEIPYEYSWVNQTVGEFRPEAFTPWPTASGVPLDSGIEITFSHEGYADPASFFTVSPAIEGRFESRGRTMVFIPAKPLTAGQVYTVTLKQGFGIASNPEMQLKEDLAYAFQASPSAEATAETVELFLPSSNEVRPATAIRIPVPAGMGKDYTVDTNVYRVSIDEAKRFVELREHPLGQFSWSTVQRKEAASIVQGKSPVFTREKLARIVEQTNSYSQSAFVELPGQSAGFYLVSLANSDDRAQQANPDWTLVQVTDLALQLIADRDRVLVWVVNSSLKQPVSGATVRMGDTQLTTGVDGTAILPLPAKYFDGQMSGSSAVVDVSQDEQETFARLQRSDFGIWYAPRTSDVRAGNRDTWSYLYIDRRVQRSDDTLNVFGLALDRGTKRVPAGLKLRIVPGGFGFFEDYRYRPHAVVLAEQAVEADANGRFQASFSWQDRRAGSYELQLMRGSSIIGSSFFEVRDEAKPTTSLDVSFDRPYAYAGDVMTGKVRAFYTDGTRLPGAEVAVEVRRSSNWETIFTGTLTTDDQGEAAFRVPTRGAVACVLAQGWPSGACGNTETLTVSARLATASEGEVYNETSAELLSSAVSLANDAIVVTPETDAYTLGAPAAYQEGSVLRLSGTVLDAVIRGENVQYSTRAGLTVTADVYRAVQERTQSGSTYNDITKRVEPTYTYTTRMERIDTRTITTNAKGRFTDSLTVDTQMSHHVILTIADGVRRRTMMYLPVSQYGEGSERFLSEGFREPGRLDLTYTTSRPKTPEDLVGESELSLNEAADMKAVLRNLPLEQSSKPLFITSIRGIQRVSYGDDEFKVVMDEAAVPMLSVYAVVFTQSEGFKVANVRFNIRQEPYKLAVDVRSDKNEYIPGEKAQFTTRVMGADDKPVAGAKVLLSVADKALVGLNAFNETNVVGELYGMYQDGIEASASTHKLFDRFAGAEGGGGGAGDILLTPRRNFKDQAAFVVGETNANGEVVLDVTMPDNLTTWRIQAVALSTDLRGGQVLTERAVRKPLAIDAVIPRVLAVGDKAELRLQPMADELAVDADVEYAIDAPTLGLNAQVIRSKGRANIHVPFVITQAMRGSHTIRVGIRSGGRQDAMEQTLEVVEPTFTKAVWESLPTVSAGFTLPENKGDSSSVLLTSRARGALLAEAQGMYEGKAYTPRLEAALAAKMAQAMIRELGGTLEESKDLNWGEYQQLGMKPLPQSSPDTNATLATLLSRQAVGDRAAMAGYLSSIYDATGSTREQRLKAAIGLALTGRPTIEVLRSAAQAPNLTWREEMVLLRGLVAIGAREEARMILDRWEQRLQQRDGRAWIQVSDVPSEIAEATRVATYAAYALANEHREAYQLYVANSFDKVTYDPVLDAQILALRIAQAPNEQAIVIYRLGEQTEEINLNNGSHWLSLNPDEWKQFSVVSVVGPVSIQWQRRVPGVPENAKGMAIARAYRPLGTEKIKEGDLVQITLSPTFSTRDTYGCYEIRDRLPANLAPVLNWSMPEGSWYPTKQMDGSLSFVSCGSYSDVIRYTARVTVAGTYTAPAPIVQHLEQPSLSAVGSTNAFSAERK